MALTLKKPEANPSQPKLDSATIDRVAHLRQVSLFAELHGNEEALQAFAAMMEEKTFPLHSKIIEEGVSGAELFILISGKASVYKATPEGDRFKVAVLPDHAFFGEGALISNEVRSATIVADSECHCLALKKSSFEEFGQKYPHWALPFYRVVASLVLSRLRKTSNDLLTLYKALVSEIRGQ